MNKLMRVKIYTAIRTIDEKVRNFKDSNIINCVYQIQFAPEHIIRLDEVLEISICNKKPSMYKIIHFSSEDVFGNSNLSRFRFYKVNCITIIKNGLKQTQILKLACDCIG